jgi:hypothetical protein
MNSYIQSNLATEEAADIVLATGADDTVATDTAYSTSCVSTLDDAEGNIKAGHGDKKTGEDKARSINAEGNDIAYAAVVVSSGKFALSESSTAVAAPDILPVLKKGVTVLGSFCMSSCMI